jgi:predicted anti-sigma-YlaC factor YlaD
VSAGWSPYTAQRYADAGGAIEDHMASCPACRSGMSCGAGDDLAEAEYRSFADFRDADPEDARRAQRTPPSWGPMS